MSSLLVIVLSAVLVSVVAIAHYAAWRPFADTADLYSNAVRLAIVLLAIAPLAAISAWLFAQFALGPLNLLYLRTPGFVALNICWVALAELCVRRAGFVPARPGFALLVNANSLVLGLSLFVHESAQDAGSVVLIALITSAAAAFLLLAFATLYERLRYADIPMELRGPPIALFTIGLMALALMGFTGLVQE